MKQTLLEGLIFAVEFDIDVNGKRSVCPQISEPLPDIPPSVFPRDGRRHSGHQYGTGGEMCLEYRSTIGTRLSPAR